MFSFFKASTPKQPIKLYNSLTRQAEEFKSLKPGEVKMYACGPTVYDHIHIGNLRAYFLPDLLHRLFAFNGYNVKYTINFTDFGHLSDDGDAGEDKIMRGMKAADMPITIEAMREYVLPYIESFKKDNQEFGNLPATTYARASDFVREQIILIKTLEQKGYAYETSDGVYFDIAKYPEYGHLGNVDIEKMKAGARVEVNEEKHHAADFALWKKANLGWDSKWGQGFPGWHIECTAMIFATLGRNIDVHTGGEDLQYTHHNAEIAQAKCTTSKSYVNYWLHNSHIKINNEKLAKSAGNGITLNDLRTKGYSPLDYRYWMLQSHYRTQANFSYEALDAAKQALHRLHRFMYEEMDGVKATKTNQKYEEQIVSAVSNDLDTPKAIATMWEMIKDDSIPDGEKVATLRTIDTLLNLGLSKNSEEGKADLGLINENELPEEVQSMIDEREAARIASNWDEADRLREALKLKGYLVEDSPEGSKVSKL